MLTLGVYADNGGLKTRVLGETILPIYCDENSKASNISEWL